MRPSHSEKRDERGGPGSKVVLDQNGLGESPWPRCSCGVMAPGAAFPSCCLPDCGLQGGMEVVGVKLLRITRAQPMGGGVCQECSVLFLELVLLCMCRLPFPHDSFVKLLNYTFCSRKLSAEKGTALCGWVGCVPVFSLLPTPTVHGGAAPWRQLQTLETTVAVALGLLPHAGLLAGCHRTLLTGPQK